MRKATATIAILLIFNHLCPAQNANKKNWYLLFSAREASLKPFSLAGHAFVSWGIDSTETDTIALPVTLGFYPAEKTNVVEGIAEHKKGNLVRGWFKNNSSRKSIITLILRTDSTTWGRALSVAESWRTSSYNLLDRNCVKFMDDVANAANLKKPRTRMILGFPRRPTNYLRRLGKKNRADIFQKTTHFFRKTPNGEEKIPLNLDLNEIWQSENISKNGKPAGQ